MATVINFALTGLPEKALIKIATMNNKTPNEYAQGIVMSFLNSQVRGFYQDKFNALTTLEMIQLFGDIS